MNRDFHFITTEGKSEERIVSRDQRAGKNRMKPRITQISQIIKSRVNLRKSVVKNKPRIKNRKMHKKIRTEIVVIIFLYLIFSVISLVTLNSHIDERESHLPTVKYFYENDILTAIKGDGYKSASTPLPYLIVSAPLKILNITPTLFTARLFNILISLIALFIFIRLCDEKKNRLLFVVLILFFYPYFLKPSFAFFMSIYGLMFFLLFIYLIEKKGNGRIFLAGLSLAAAVLCQQFYLIVFVFYAGYLLYKEFRLRVSLESLLHLFYFLLPFILPVIVFLLWRGLVHPSYQAWGTAYSLAGLTGVLIALGAVLLPYIAFNIKEIRLKEIPLLLILSLMLMVFAFPVWASQPTEGGITGITFNFLSKVNDFSGVISIILKTSFCFSGMASFLICFKKIIDDKSKLMYLLYIALAIGFSLNRLPSERHMLPLIVTAYLFIFNMGSKESLLKSWLAYQVIIGGVYFYYIMF